MAAAAAAATASPPKCKCNPQCHVEQMTAKECEFEIENKPDEAAEREVAAHTHAYESTLAGYNESEGYPKIVKWSKANHPKLCCELRHKNRK